MSSRTTTVENAPTDSLSTMLTMETVTAVKPPILMPLVPVTFTKLPVPVQPLNLLVTFRSGNHLMIALMISILLMQAQLKSVPQTPPLLLLQVNAQIDSSNGKLMVQIAIAVVLRTSRTTIHNTTSTESTQLVHLVTNHTMMDLV
jgi:hypothetical protein